MLPVVASVAARGGVVLRGIRPLFSRFAAPGSRLAPSTGSAWSKFITKFRSSGKLKWMFGIVRDAAAFSVAMAGIDWVLDWYKGDDSSGTSTDGSSNQKNAMQSILINELVALALDSHGLADPDSQATILDNFALMRLSSSDGNGTLEGLATAAAAEYLRRTRNGSFVYDLADALNVLHISEQEFEDVESPNDLTDSEVKALIEAIDELQGEIGSSDISRLADLMAFQCSYIRSMNLQS